MHACAISAAPVMCMGVRTGAAAGAEPLWGQMKSCDGGARRRLCPVAVVQRASAPASCAVYMTGLNTRRLSPQTMLSSVAKLSRQLMVRRSDCVWFVEVKGCEWDTTCEPTTWVCQKRLPPA